MKDKSMLFSQAALDKLRTPDRLDTVFRITTPTGWMLMLAIGVILIAVLLWSVFGAFTVKTEGMGLLLDSAGVVQISPETGGQITKIYVTTGSAVKKHDIIARLEIPSKIANKQMAKYGMDLASNNQEVRQKAHNYDLNNYDEFVSMYVYAEHEGIVDEIMAYKGQNIAAGTPICSLRRTQKRNDLTGLLYIPVEKGKRVEPGMTVQLVPNGVDVSEAGSLLGVVRSVSQYPVSTQTAQNNLGNIQMANWFFEQQKSSLMEVRFELVEDPSSPSGYLWTSSVGEHKPVSAGSYCKGTIVIERRPPIERVFYRLSQWLRSR